MASYIKLATTTISADTGEVEFTNIPQYCQHLYVVIQGKGTLSGNNTNVYWFANNDIYNSNDNAFYGTRYVLGQNSARSTASSETAVYGYLSLTSGATNSANHRGNVMMTILDYSVNGRQKPFFYMSNAEHTDTASKYHSWGHGNYASKAPITSLKFTTDQPSSTYLWQSGATFDLYGLRLA